MNTPIAPLIGPAAKVLQILRHLAADGRDRLAVLLDGDPGVGKTAAADILAADLAGGQDVIEHVNGQSVGVDLVRQWRARCQTATLFSHIHVKRVDEIDQASPAAIAELLTFLDRLPPHTFILVTTNEFPKLRAASKGRLESRFIRLPVAAPSVNETTALLRRRGVPAGVAREIALGSVPDGCLATAGCNVRTALNDATGFLAAAAVGEEAA